MSKSINEIAATVKEVKGATRTLNRYSDAIQAHLQILGGVGERKEKSATKSLGQVFNAATTGKTRVTPGMIKTLANNSLAKLPGYREDIAIDAGTSAKVKTDSAMIRNGGAVVTAGVVDALEKAAARFITLYEGFKSDAIVNEDNSLTLDAAEQTLESVTA